MNLDELRQRVSKNTTGHESLSSQMEELEAKLQDPSVWSDQKLASEIGQQVREIKEKISLFQGWKSILEDAITAQEIGDDELIQESEKALVELEKQQIEAASPVLTEQAPPAISAIFDTEEPKVQTDIEVELPDIIQYGAQVIGKIVLEGTKASNSFKSNPSEYSKDLINLVLGKTEVCKSTIYDICQSAAEDAEKIKNIDDVYKDAADYFQSLYKQV